MRKMKVYRNAAIALLMTVMFTACMNDPDPVFDIMGDVFVTKKIINDEIKYAPNYFVYSNIGMNSAKVTLPNGGGTVDLEGTTGGLTYKKEAVDSDYSLEMPDEGNYLFEAVSTKDETLQVGDELQLYDLEIPVVDSIEFLNTSTMQVSWNSVSGADGYFLKIVDANGDDVFLSLSLDANAHDYKKHLLLFLFVPIFKRLYLRKFNLFFSFSFLYFITYIFFTHYGRNSF